MKIAVTGATGLLGRQLVVGLSRHGHEVVAGYRSIESLTRIQDWVESECGRSVRWVQSRMELLSELRRLCKGCDGLVHAAYAHERGRYRGGEATDPENFWKANGMGTIRTFEVADLEGVERLVALSSRAVFDGVETSPADGIADDHPVMPTTRYGELKALTEAMVRSCRTGCRVGVRPTGIYGTTWPVSDCKWWQLAMDARRHGSVSEAGHLPRTEVWVGDVVEAIQLLLTAPAERVQGRVFNCSDIAVAPSDTWKLLRTIQHRSDPSSHPELASREPPPKSLNCDGLKTLGWSPSGYDKYLEVLHELAQQAASALPVA